MLATTAKSLDDLPEPFRSCTTAQNKSALAKNKDMLFLLLAALVFLD